MIEKRVLFVSGVYLLLTTLAYLFFNKAFLSEKVRPFTAGVPAAERVWELTTYDGGQSSVWVTRLVHNKVFYTGDSYMLNTFRLVDPVFLFSLSNRIGLYDFSTSRHVLFPIEFPVFVFAVLVLLRKKHPYQKVIRVTGICILVCVLFLATTFFPPHPMFLLPLVLLVRLIMILGVVTFLIKKK